MSAAGSKRRSYRQAVSRHQKRSRYTEVDTDSEDFDIDSEADFEPDPAPAPAQQAAPKRQKQSTKKKPQTRSKTVRSKPFANIGKARKVNTHSAPPKKEFNGPSDRKIPAWTSLPVNILRDIFFYASEPLYELTVASANASWLMKSSRTCRAFAQPALEAYYQSPAMFNSTQPHQLLELLQVPNSQRFFDYNVKIKSLVLDVYRLAYTAPNRGAFDLGALVKHLPQLQHMEITSPDELPSFRSPPSKLRWAYPADLFQALTDGNQKLKTWRWRRKMIAEKDPAKMYTDMLQIHSSKSFEYLEKLVVCWFNATDSTEPEAPTDHNAVAMPGLATSIAVLPNLKDLTFVSCDMVMEKFLERLPYGLERLELSNCLEVTSDMLVSYFAKFGSTIKELVLNYNPALTLGFLPSLKASCPNLEVLKMDLRYFSERENSDDSEPLYDELLGATDIPTWPTSLRHLELLQLQRWSSEAAENLFNSLIDSAKDLPNLRFLTLHTHINIPWRDRAGFRDRNIGRLQRVYLRKHEAHSQYLGSLRQWRLYKQAQADGRTGAITIDSDDEPLIRRKVTSVTIAPYKHTGETDAYSDSAAEGSSAQPQRRSRRVADTQASAVSASATPSPDSESENSGNDDPVNFVQGLCNVVDIRIDNQRPRENQLTEADFLDDEKSGDEDWHEGADDFEEDRYAW